MPVGAPSEEGMPDWLRPLQSNTPGSSALRGGAPPAMPGGPYGAPQPPGMFSAGSLVNEDALPEWLREPGMSGALGHGAGAAGNRGLRPDMGPARPYSPGGHPGPLTAPPLIDPTARPSWLAGGQPQQPPGSGGLNSSGGMSANSLVDEAALPQWLRAVPPAQASPSAAAYANAPAPAPWTATAAAADEPLPTWLKQVYVEANVPQNDKLQTPPGY